MQMHADPGNGNASGSVIRRDPLIERLVRAILPAKDAGEVLRGFYTEALHAALLKRLADLRGDTNSGAGVRRSMPLPAWRLKRVSDFVDANLDRALSLAALAEAAGLSRMYFAAQFRRATGMRPHDYVVRRRIQRAKVMLSQPGSRIVDTAFSVGFQSQSHFTTVFKRIAGVTPQRWRSAHDHAAGTGGAPLSPSAAARQQIMSALSNGLSSTPIAPAAST
jgi:AraC-like DNA-binding protein